MSDATASKMEKTTASAGKLYRECPSSEKGAIYLSGTNVNGYFVEVAATPSGGTLATASEPPTNVSAVCPHCQGEFVTSPKEWMCPECGHLMTETESKLYRTCPTGKHLRRHIKVAPKDVTGDTQLTIRQREQKQRPTPAHVNKNVAGTASEHDSLAICDSHKAAYELAPQTECVICRLVSESEFGQAAKVITEAIPRKPDSASTGEDARENPRLCELASDMAIKWMPEGHRLKCQAAILEALTAATPSGGGQSK